MILKLTFEIYVAKTLFTWILMQKINICMNFCMQETISNNNYYPYARRAEYDLNHASVYLGEVYVSKSP